MPDTDPRGLAARLVAVASRLAPAANRVEFRREWEAEIAWAGRCVTGGGHARALRVELVRRACGAFVHALWLRKEQWSLDMLWQDLKYAWRVLAGRPSFAIVAGLTLALGIGANTAIFSIVYGVLLKPLPFRDPDRLVQIWETNPLRNWTDATASPANLLDWKRRNRVFEDIAFYPGMDDRTPMYANATLTASGAEPERLQAARASTNLFRVLGVQPMLGRGFRPEEETPGQHRVVILTHATWLGRFNADRNIIGRDITLNTLSYRVIGVMPRSFTFPDPAVQVWLPFVIDEDFASMRRPHYLRPIARLKPGVSIDQARQDLRSVAAQLEKEYPDTNTQMGADLGPLQEWIVGDVRTALLLFLAAASLVLLVACANLANLLLARAAGRTRELAVRAALGAGGWRLARQMLTESLLLAVLGGLIGVLLARWTLGTIISLSPADLPRLEEVALDGRVLIFVAALTSLTALLFGVMPAWHGAKADAAWLKDGTRTAGGAGPTRRILVVAQVAASAALVVCAGLLLRSFERLQAVPPGFNPENVVTFRISLPAAKYQEDAQVVQFFEDLLAKARGLPGVLAAGGSTVIGLDGAGWTGDLFVDGRPGFQARELRHKDVTPGYFAAMGLAILRGRDLSAEDTADAPRAAVVNEALVRAYFRDEDPIGRRISYSYNRQQPNWRTIVGVARDEKQDSLAEPVRPEVYESHRQNPRERMTIVVRASLPAATLIPALRRELQALDNAVAMYDVRTLHDVLATSVARERFTTFIVMLFASLALAIAAIGVYGVINYSVSRRTQEIGVRVALGASRSHVMWLVFSEAMALVGAGLTIGFVLSAAAGQAIRSLLYETAPTDPLTYAAVLAVLGTSALLATYVPARRALRVDPTEALRYE